MRPSVEQLRPVWFFLLVLAGPLASYAAEWPYLTRRQSFVFHADFPLDPDQELVTELVQLQAELAQRLRIFAA